MQFDEIMSSLACENQRNFSQKNELNTYLLKLKKDYEKFLQKYKTLGTYTSSTMTDTIPADTVEIKHNSEAQNSNSQTSLTSIEAVPNELMSTINQLIPCIGCRASIERFYKNLRTKQTGSKKNSNSTLDPFLINSTNGNLSLKKAILLNPMSIFKLFYING